MNRTLRGVLVAAAAAGCACSPSADPSDSAGETHGGFQTSRTHYGFTRTAGGIEAHIPYVYRNATADTVYLTNCNRIIAPALEKRIGDTWTSVWYSATPACLSPPLIVPPHGEYADTVHVLSGPDTFPRIGVADIEGTYRLVWHGVVHAYRDDVADLGTSLPQDERTSNPFTLSAPP